jgi:uncharacterized protein (TIGR02246 family)
MLRKLVIATVLTSVAISPANAADALAHVSLDWAANWQAKKLDAVLALYTDDAVFLDADGSRVTGRRAIHDFFATVLTQYSANRACGA